MNSLGLRIVGSAVLVIFGCTLIASRSAATHLIEYRWQSPHVTMHYSDVVGTPVPTSYGFWANMQDLGHKKRFMESFMCSAVGRMIGDRLCIEVSLFGLGALPPKMELTGRATRAVVEPPFSDPRTAYVLSEMAEGRSPMLAGDLTLGQLELGRRILSAFADDGFPVFSPAGDRIAFQSWRGDGIVDVLIADRLGTRATRLGANRVTSLTPVAYVHSVFGFPTWSPDGRMVAYIADGRIAVADTTRGLVTLLGDAENPITSLVWSPDGKTMAATVAAQEADIRYVQDVLLLDPAGRARPISLRDRLKVLERGHFPAHLDWSPDSRLLAVVMDLVDLELGADGGYVTSLESRNSVLCLVDVASRKARSVELPGLFADGGWETAGRTWAAAVRAGEESRLLYISAQNLSVRTVHKSMKPIAILGIEGERGLFLDGERLVLADAAVGTLEPLAGVRAEAVQLFPGIYGAYLGAGEDIVTRDEAGLRVVLLEFPADLESSLPGVNGGAIITKKWGKVIAAARGLFRAGWLSKFVRENEIVWLDWSPGARVLAAAASRSGGTVEMLVVKPGGRPTEVSRTVSSLPIKSFNVRAAGADSSVRNTIGAEGGKVGADSAVHATAKGVTQSRPIILAAGLGGLFAIIPVVAVLVLRRARSR